MAILTARKHKILSAKHKNQNTKPLTNNPTYPLLPGSAVMLLSALLLFFSSCTGLRTLPEDEYLYKGSRIHIEKEEEFKDERKVKEELDRVMRPSPNTTLFISRPRMWMYQVAGEPTGTGLRHWMRNRLGEQPVLFDQQFVERNMRLVNNRLYNMGYFDAVTTHAPDSARRTVAVDYQVYLKPPYKFGQLSPVDEDTPLAAAINAQLENSLIIPDEPYSLELLREERRRIDRELKKQGYFYFHPDHILFRVDSAAGNRKADLYAVIKYDIPEAATRKYRIGNIYIHADYMSAGRDYVSHTDTISPAEGIYFTDALEQFNPETIMRAIFLKKDSIYDVADHNRTLNHLMSLGAFQFVNLRFSAREQQKEHLLDVRVLLTPIERRSISAELKGVTKSNHFSGPGINTTLTNHNLFKGAESLQLSLSGAYEWLIGRQRSASLREFGLEASLSFPRFVLPSGWTTSPRVLAPKTTISLGVDFLNRTDAFNLTTMHAQYGYSWNRDMATQLRIFPVVFNIFALGDVEEDMEDMLLHGTPLRRGLFEQFIIGSQYTWIYNSRLKPGGDNDWFIQANLDLSGNLAYLLMNNVLNVSPLDDGGYGFFNQSFAQYARTDFDLRYYHQLGNGRRLVTRLFAGAGVPYGNSDVLPYIKQYVIGGSNSIRAFHPRTLGPGSYASADNSRGGYNIYQTGDLKLEANIEYRFDITNLFKGAFFADAGNIWRLYEDEEVPGGKFSADRFYKEVALGVGTGLRIDAGFFILRFDFAFPLADPATDDDRFFDSVRLFDRQWRRDHLVFNLGIGYPF